MNTIGFSQVCPDMCLFLKSSCSVTREKTLGALLWLHQEVIPFPAWKDATLEWIWFDHDDNSWLLKCLWRSSKCLHLQTLVRRGDLGAGPDKVRQSGTHRMLSIVFRSVWEQYMWIVQDDVQDEWHWMIFRMIFTIMFRMTLRMMFRMTLTNSELLQTG